MKKRVLGLFLLLFLISTLFIPATPVLAEVEWLNPETTTGTTEGPGGWNGLQYGIDGNPETSSSTHYDIYQGNWSPWYYFQRDSEDLYSSIRFMATGHKLILVEVQAYWGEEWHSFSASPGTGVIIDLEGEYNITNTRIRGKNGVGMAYPQAVHYVQYGRPPVAVQTNAVSNYDPDAESVTLNADLTCLGGYVTLYGYFEWGDSPSLGETTAEQELTETGEYHADLTSIEPGTYYYRAVIRQDTSYTYGEGKAWSFVKPTIYTDSASDRGTTTATLNGDLTSMGDYTTVDVDFQWGVGDYANNTTDEELTSSGTFDADLTGLDSGETYQYRTRVKYGLNEYIYGSQKTFTTLSEAPSQTVATEGAGEITLTWTKGEGATYTVIQRSTTDYPATHDAGFNVYQGSGSFYVDQELTDIPYYYSLWSLTGEDYSEFHDTASATPNPLPGRCEYYNEGDDSYSMVYGTNWGSEVITVTWQHNIEAVRLKMYKVGNPGTFTVSLYLLDPNGRPMTPALTAGTINANYITELTCGNWYEVEFEGIEFEVGQEVAIVFSAASGDVDNYVGMRYNSSGDYEGGIALFTSNAGFTWDKNLIYDYMFEVYSKFLLEVLDVKVFRTYIEEGDWLFVFSYKNIFRPGASPGEYFDIQLLDGEVVLSQIKLPAWGYRPGSIYICPAEVLPLSWGHGYTIRMVSRFVTGEGDRLIADYTLERADWTGEDLTVLDNWVLMKAGSIGDFYTYDVPVGIDSEDNIVYEEVGLVLTGFTGGLWGIGAKEKLNDQGSAMFLIGIPMLNLQRPDLFLEPAGEIDIDEPEWTHAGDTRDWEEIMGEDTVAMATAVGLVCGIEGKEAMQIGVAALCLIVACVVGSTGLGVIGLGAPAPILVAAVLGGIYPTAGLLVAAALVGLVLIYIAVTRAIA